MTGIVETMVVSRRTLLAAILAVLVPSRAGADLVGREEIRAAVTGKPDDVLIAVNPALQRLAREDPARLREVLERLRAQPRPHRRTLARNQPEPATAAESATLAENPDLAELYRESPEAALDLLRLIREAAKKK